ncbi:Hypothetical predicted protein [Marmota monax]|uniref:Carboxylic ester hydrolase n=1 Tax=Marmota monax TaxID=9995 RepID=A0A5E4AG30_MARMO|nr:hypothetical protein GHT09_006102 [Marmota monax]VTJ56383.1 Hypothetical predicted protein [Marmota monax]
MYLNTGKQYKWLRFSEDCLYLNVYAPVHAHGDPLLPVMVWFPGGAFLVGSASTYEGSELAAREKVVLVFLQHRLGILGFLSTSDNQARGNWALLDQIEALRWVQENIEAFGGDPNSVTLFGQSSGAMCISGLMLSPLAQGLFHRAISQSGTVLFKVFITRDPLKVAKEVAHLAGCNHNSTRIIIECLRSLSGAQMMRVSRKMNVTKEQIPLVVEEYLNDTPKHDWKVFRNHVMDLAGDATFVYTTLQAARYYRDASFPVYLYEFEHHAPSGIIVKPRNDGADHGDEIRFIFGSPFSKGSFTDGEKALSLRMMKYWANFARTGNPNDGKLPYWPRYDKDEKYLQLNLTTGVGVKLKDKKMAFWRRLRQSQRPEKQKQF